MLFDSLFNAFDFHLGASIQIILQVLTNFARRHKKITHHRIRYIPIILQNDLTTEPVITNIPLIHRIPRKPHLPTGHRKHPRRRLHLAPLHQHPQYLQNLTLVYVLPPHKLLDQLDHLIDLLSDQHRLEYLVGHVFVDVGVLLEFAQFGVDVAQRPEFGVGVEVVEEAWKVDVVQVGVVAEALDFVVGDVAVDGQGLGLWEFVADF